MQRMVGGLFALRLPSVETEVIKEGMNDRPVTFFLAELSHKTDPVDDGIRLTALLVGLGGAF